MIMYMSVSFFAHLIESFDPSTMVERSILDKSVDMKDHTAGKTA